MVESIFVERIVADVRSAQMAAQIASILGGSVDLPVLDDRLDDFRRALNVAPVMSDPEEQQLRDALGLG